MGVIGPAWAGACVAGVAIAAVVSGSHTALTGTDGAGAELFVTQIKPILSNRCFKCHGPDDASREADLRFDLRDGAVGSVIVPGDADASEMIRRITSDDPDVVMPPPETGAPLDAAAIDAITRWIDDGAPYARHWSFVAPAQLEAAGRRPDRHRRLRARPALASEGLEPSPPADRYTLIRRVTLDPDRPAADARAGPGIRR